MLADISRDVALKGPVTIALKHADSPLAITACYKIELAVGIEISSYDRCRSDIDSIIDPIAQEHWRLSRL